MLRIFLIIIFAVFAASEMVFAEQKVPQTLEEITAALKAKKTEMEPFKDEDVKVDLESLGLDNLDHKQPEMVELPKEKEQKVVEEEKIEEAKKVAVPAKQELEVKKEKIEKKLEEVAVIPELNIEQPKSVESKNKSSEIAPDVGDGFVKKIGNFLHHSEDKVTKEESVPKMYLFHKQKESEVEKKEDVEKNINPVAEKTDVKKVDKKLLRKRLEAERIRNLNEKKRQENLKQLEKLRKKYLLKVSKNKVDDSDDEGPDYEDESDADFAEEKIIPHKKDINRFISEEPPAPPIMEPFRTSDNLHIPAVLTNEQRVNILFEAAASDSISFFNAVFKDIQNPNVRNNLGDTVLTYSVLMQKYPVIASVLARGANPNMPNELGYTPLNIAIELLDIKAIEILVNNKADIRELDAFGRTYLMHAVRVGFLPAVELFVSRGLDVNAMDDDGFTALSIAYRHKKEVIVKFLLKNGAKTWIEKPYNPEKQTLIKDLENRWN